MNNPPNIEYIENFWSNATERNRNAKRMKTEMDKTRTIEPMPRVHTSIEDVREAIA